MPPTRVELRHIVHDLLAHAGPTGISEPDLLDALADHYTPNTLQPLLDDLSSAGFPLTLTTDATNTRRWRLTSAPTTTPGKPLTLRHLDDLEQHGIDPDLGAQINQAIIDLDKVARNALATTGLPPAHAQRMKAMLGFDADPLLVARLGLLCRRKSVKILYESPYQSPPIPTWHDIEPWAVQLDPDAPYLRAWLIAESHPCTFDLRAIRALEDLDIAPPRQPVPSVDTDRWYEDWSGAGPDTDRPGVAHFEVRGAAARSIANSRWHPLQLDQWKTPGQVLVRVASYHNIVEMARRLAKLPGVVIHDSPELEAEVLALAGETPKPTQPKPKSTPKPKPKPKKRKCSLWPVLRRDAMRGQGVVPSAEHVQADGTGVMDRVVRSAEQVLAGIDVAQLRGLDQRVEDRSDFSAAA